MKDVIQLIIAILTLIIAIVGYVLVILRFKSSRRDHCDELWLFEGLTASSAFAMWYTYYFLLEYHYLSSKTSHGPLKPWDVTM